MSSDDFRALWDQIVPIGRDERTGGYLRYAFSEPELRLRVFSSLRTMDMR